MHEKRSIVEGRIFEQAYSMDNYLIEYDKKNPSNGVCAIYVSSSGIYYPNTEEELVKQIIEKNKYEWYRNRFSFAEKHIFIRDVAKQFYITGISKNYYDIDKVIEFLKIETEGYRVYVIGSSAGGYMATVVGVRLNAELIYSFSGYFDLNIVDKEAWFFIDKFRYDQNRQKYYDISELVQNCPSLLVYIYPTKLKDDVKQSECIQNSDYVIKIPFRSKIHGVPFTSRALKKILSMDVGQARDVFVTMHNTKKVNSTLSFDIYLFGYVNGMIDVLIETVKILIGRMKSVYKRVIKRK